MCLVFSTGLVGYKICTKSVCCSTPEYYVENTPVLVCPRFKRRRTRSLLSHDNLPNWMIPPTHLAAIRKHLKDHRVTERSWEFIYPAPVVLEKQEFEAVAVGLPPYSPVSFTPHLDLVTDIKCCVNVTWKDS